MTGQSPDVVARFKQPPSDVLPRVPEGAGDDVSFAHGFFYKDLLHIMSSGDVSRGHSTIRLREHVVRRGVKPSRICLIDSGFSATTSRHFEMSERFIKYLKIRLRGVQRGCPSGKGPGECAPITKTSQGG